MRRLKTQFMLTAVVAGLLATGSSCRQTRTTTDDAGRLPLLSVIRVAQPRAEAQLLEGFWQVENNSWRWTKHDFAVVLMPPIGAAQKGATLDFRFALTPGLIERQKAVTIAASVGGVTLPPDTYRQAGSCAYVREVPAAAFAAGGPVRVAFSADKYFAAGEIEGRELAVIASSIGLVSK
jgi:hypothetical protein